MQIKIEIPLYTLACIVLCAMLWSCSPSTSSSCGIVTGIISLDGSPDHSGVIVSVYNAGVAPVNLRTIMDEYPQLAFPIDDKALFDHREHEALHSVYTDNEGNFSFPKLPYDEYIVAYSKEGWGYNYLFDIELNSDEMDISERLTPLHPEILLPQYIDQQYILEEGQCYRAVNDVVLSENSQLVIQSGSRLLLNNDVKLSIYGSLVTPSVGGKAHITSFSGIHSGTIPGSEKGEGMRLYVDNLQVGRLVLSHLSGALQVFGDGITSQNLLFHNNMFALRSVNASDITLNNCCFMNNLIETCPSAMIENGHNIAASNNLFYGNEIALTYKLTLNSSVSNNAFIENNVGFANEWDSRTVLSNNVFTGNGTGVENSGRSNLEIYLNEFKCSTGVKTYHANNAYNYPNNGWTKANDNNFDCGSYAVKSLANYYGSEQPVHLDFTQNFWGTNDQDQIEQLIIDRNDIGDLGGSGVTTEIDYLPFRSNPVSSAGILRVRH